MSASFDDQVVVTDGPSTRDSRLYHWVLDHLAKFPGRVTVVTFVAGVIVTVVVVLFGGDGSPTTVVGLVATLWALFFAVMIYLLTARDTDTVLEQIADLHEQLATALASPDEDAGDGEEESAGEEASSSAVGEPATQRPPAPAPEPAPAPAPAPVPVPAPAPAPVPAPGPAVPGRTRRESGQHGGPHGGSQVVSGAAEIAAAVPRELLDAWKTATGGSADDLERAWTRDPRSDRQWVLETGEGERWVVFTRGAQGTGVISLSNPPGFGRGRRPARPAR
ncbi:hypothetical protein ACFVU2_05865 [Leifsonia sp. NPDC058194]|uniref:hypothetical protein n=1 Tax=Leifsonia sp. NPDC058194 TaxID=3346374 RepID=UPI0036DCECEC